MLASPLNAADEGRIERCPAVIRSDVDFFRVVLKSITRSHPKEDARLLRPGKFEVGRMARRLGGIVSATG